MACCTQCRIGRVPVKDNSQISGVIPYKLYHITFPRMEMLLPVLSPDSFQLLNSPPFKHATMTIPNVRSYQIHVKEYDSFFQSSSYNDSSLTKRISLCGLHLDYAGIPTFALFHLHLVNMLARLCSGSGSGEAMNVPIFDLTTTIS
jgi:hypothetical protein